MIIDDMSLAAYGIIVLAASGIAGAGILFRHRRVSTFLAAAAVIFEIEWLLLTVLARLADGLVSAGTMYLIGSLGLLGLWLAYARQWRGVAGAVADVLRREAAIIGLLLLTVGGAMIVMQTNGPQGDGWVLHSFYNGDVATFTALVERGLHTQGWVQENPFAGNGSLEYPTLLHSGVAGFLNATGLDEGWLNFLPVFTVAQLMVTVPLFFLLWDVMVPERSEAWQLWYGLRRRGIVLGLQAALTAYVLFISWDSYIYPQSHFFLTAIFLLLVAVLAGRAQNTTLRLGVAWATALCLLLSNAVLGAAAVAGLVVWHLLATGNANRQRNFRLLHGAAGLLWIILFLTLSSGEAVFGWPQFSYTAAAGALAFVPLVAGLVIGILLQVPRHMFVAAWSVLLMVMAGFTFFFSGRDIIVENAPRFLYAAALVGFPLLLEPTVRAVFWVRRQFFLTSRTMPERLVSAGALLTLLGVALLPAAASVASAHAHLLQSDEHGITAAQLAATDWIRTETDPRAVFMVNPLERYVSFFTGRAQLRTTDFWLSPQDETLVLVQQAFAGDRGAQMNLASQADFLLLSGEERELWPATPHARVFENETITIYRLNDNG